MKRAVILAGGRGTRLRPYTVVLPKPLVPLGDMPILEIVIRQLRAAGFGHITLAVNHQAELLEAFFGTGDKWGIRIDYSLESQPLSTIGPLKLISDLPETFLVMNGDVLSDVDYGQFLDEHSASGAEFTISAAERTEMIDYGVLHADEQNNLVGFEEKPRNEYLVSMGVYGVTRRVLERVPEGEPFGFDDLMRAMLTDNARVRVRPYSGYWMDIGRPSDYGEATEDFEFMRSKLIGE